MAAPAPPGSSKLQQLDKDSLLKLLKKQAEQQKALKTQLEDLARQRDELLTNGHPESDGSGIEKLRAEYEGKLQREKDAAAETASSLKALSMELSDYDKKIKNFKEEKASLTQKLEASLASQSELSAQLQAIRAELDETKNFSEDVTKALEIAKQEVEELRLQKQEAENSKMEILQSKMNEDSHSTKQVLDLTTELAQCNRQIEILRSSLSSIKVQRDTLASENQILEEKLSVSQDEYAKYTAKTKLIYDDTWKNMMPSSLDSLNQEINQLKTNLQLKDSEIERLKVEALNNAEEFSRLKDKVSRAEREAEKWKSEALTNNASLTQAFDDLRDLRSRYEAALLDEQTRSATALEREKKDHETLLEKALCERKLDANRADQQVLELRNEIDVLQREKDDLQKQLDVAKKATPSTTSAQVASTSAPIPSKQLEREHHPHQHHPIQQTFSSISAETPRTEFSPEPIDAPLQDVLFGDQHSDRIEGSIYGEDRISPSLPELKEALKVAEQQNTTLRELLADSENANELFSDQVALLKEEIRRIQRNSERENHVNNTEYLKNIVFQFMRPEKVSGERRQLLPILRTMLQLSDDEYRTMFNMTTEAVPADATTPTGGLASFFHRWNGL